MQPDAFPIFSIDQLNRFMKRVQPASDGLSEFGHAERRVVAQPDDALCNSQQVANPMIELPIHKLQAGFHQIICSDFRSQPSGRSYEIVHNPEHQPRKQKPKRSNYDSFVNPDLNEIRCWIKRHQNLSSCEVQGMLHRGRVVEADGGLDGFNCPMPCERYEIVRLTRVGCVVDAEIHRDAPRLDESS